MARTPLGTMASKYGHGTGAMSSFYGAAQRVSCPNRPFGRWADVGQRKNGRSVEKNLSAVRPAVPTLCSAGPTDTLATPPASPLAVWLPAPLYYIKGSAFGLWCCSEIRSSPIAPGRINMRSAKMARLGLRKSGTDRTTWKPLPRRRPAPGQHRMGRRFDRQLLWPTERERRSARRQK